MDHVIGRQAMISASGEAAKRVFKRVPDGTRGYFFYPHNAPNPADHVYHWKDSGGKSRGFAGAVVGFRLDDGSRMECQGPWHTNSEHLKSMPGIDITDKHWTKVVLGKGQAFGTGTPFGKITDVIHEDTEWVVGRFSRGKEMAEDAARKLGIEIFGWAYTQGGAHSLHARKPEVDDAS